MQEEVCIVPAPPVCLLPVCSYARLTAYFGILPTRSPILSERDLTPSSSARGATLAVLASSVSRILPGQEYSIVTAIAAGRAYCNAPPLIPQGQKRQMFLIAEIFLKLFFDTEKATRLFTVGWLCFYDVKSINRNLSVRLIDKFQNGFFLIYVVYGWRILRCYLCPKFFCSRIFLVVFYFPFAMID